jgi:hypothetical protein
MFRILFLLIFWVGISTVGMAQSSGYVDVDTYNKGAQAYNAADWKTAITLLSRFRDENLQGLEKDPAFKKDIDGAIHHSQFEIDQLTSSLLGFRGEAGQSSQISGTSSGGNVHGYTIQNSLRY